MELQFSTYPGCWERHLQRQYNNPLFLHRLHHPMTQEDIEMARRRDEEERRAFQKAFEELLQAVSTLQAQVEAKIVLHLKNKIDSLYEQCAGLGGNFITQKQGLRQLYNLIMQAIWASGIKDPQTILDLEKEVADHQMHLTLLERPLVAHLLHPKSPIVEEDIIPTLLTEDETSLRAAMSLFNPQQQQILCQEARKLLTQLKQRGYSLPTAWVRLDMMEQPLYRPH